ncbi:retinol dehydrogenase 7 isoform X2 [Exaiptasia diaphana]|uniref:Uncharacterized protein n=1 Tax=Exaiptasia diaphana TaxID=2652724 RepID=A0A913YW54_EXADI|nr:retinol dehydrogenase 7 isoform X2 [Exaiptasia diaphana]
MEIEWNSLLITLILLILFLTFTTLKKILLPMPRVSSFDEKYILITGCDSGFGKSTAVRLDRLGLNVFATCLTKKGKENLERLCTRRLTVIIMDVTDSAQIRNCLQIVQKKIPPNVGLWALINNAGCMTFGPLEWFSLDDYKKMADVNLWGLIDMTKHFLPLIKKAKGRVVNFSSIAGKLSKVLGLSSCPKIYCILRFVVLYFPLLS